MSEPLAQCRADLTAIPDLYALLGLFRIRGAVVNDGPSGKPGSRPPLNLVVLDLCDAREKADAESVRLDYDLDRRAGARRQGVLPTLESWVRLVDGELWDEGVEHAEPSEAPTISSECAFLLLHADWCADQQWFRELADEVGRIHADIRQAVGEPQIRLICLVPGCGWDVEEMAAGAWFRCTGCERTWTRMELHQMQREREPKALAEIAKLVHRPAQTLHRWHKLRLIRPVARAGRESLFLLHDVRRVALHIREKGAKDVS